MNNSLMLNGQPPLKNSAINENKRKTATIFGLASIYGSQVDENATALWLSLIEQYTANQVEAGAKRLMQKEKLFKMPPPAMLIEYIEELESEKRHAEYKKKMERRKKFEDAKKELKEKYRKKFDRIYDLCFSKEIDGNEYKRRHDALCAESRKAFDKLEAEEKAGMLEISYGKD